MDARKTSERKRRLRRFARAMVIAGCLLLTLGVVLLVGYTNRGADSVRFARLRGGMTMPEVLLVLQPMTTVDRDSPPEDGPVAEHRVILFQFNDDPLFPAFGAALTFDQGRLTAKELRGPTLREVLQHW